jgi:hypothetical protein
MQPSNWSQNRVPSLNDDAEINNTLPTVLSLQLNLGSSLNCRSLSIKGMVNLINFGNIELNKSYGDGLYLSSQATFENRNVFKITNPCQKAATINGTFSDRGTSIIIK